MAGVPGLSSLACQHAHEELAASLRQYGLWSQQARSHRPYHMFHKLKPVPLGHTCCCKQRGSIKNSSQLALHSI
eukprot:510785-Amphidinium_carterae.1